MKIRICLCIIVVLLVIWLNSCSSGETVDVGVNNQTLNSNDDVLDSFCEESDDKVVLNTTSDPFELEMRSVFDSFVQNNPIDSDYNYEQTNSTTLSLRDLENEYANIWLSEMDYSCVSLCSLLNEDDKAKFEQLQKDWFEALNAEFDFVSDIFSNEDYQLLVGSTFWLERDFEYRQVIRERTLYIKYIEFCIKYNSEVYYDSLVNFQYKS